MKAAARIILSLTMLMVPISATEITIGTRIGEANKAMKIAGYKKTGLAMGIEDRNKRLAFWSVDEGVLIAVYSTETKKIVSVTYWLCDDRPAISRKEFDLEVKAFDTSAGAMTLQLKQPKREQAGADQPATKPADKPAVKDQPSTPTSRDAPR